MQTQEICAWLTLVATIVAPIFLYYLDHGKIVK